MPYPNQMGLGCNLIQGAKFAVLESDDASALWGVTQTQPLTLFRLPNNDYLQVDGVATYALGQSFGTGMKMADNVTGIAANANWDNVKSIGGGIMLGVITSSGSGKSYVIRSHNYGASWGTNDNNNRAAVLNLGDTATNGKSDGTTQTSLVSVLGTRGWCVATVNGQRIILINEYSTNAASGTNPVGANAQVRVWRSDDLGKTWSILLTFNTNTGGSRQVRHGHYVGQDPYSGFIYFGYGDSAESAIIRWDGVSAAPPANTLPANFGNYPGWLGIGVGNFANYVNGSGQTNVDVWQITDLAYTEGWIINPADNGDSAANNRGIWRFRRDFTGLTRVFTTTRTGHSDYWVLKHSSGLLYTIEILEATAVDSVLYMKSSNDDGGTWVECARFIFKSGATTGSVDAFLERVSDGSIWLSTLQGKLTVPSANRCSVQVFPTQLFSPTAAVTAA